MAARFFAIGAHGKPVDSLQQPLDSTGVFGDDLVHQGLHHPVEFADGTIFVWPRTQHELVSCDHPCLETLKRSFSAFETLNRVP